MRAGPVRRSASLFLSIPLLAAAAWPQVDLAAEALQPHSDASVSLSIPEGYVASGPLHRFRIDASDALLDELLAADAIAWMEPYPSFAYALVDARRAGGLEALLARGAQLADEDTLINVNGYLLDGADARATGSVLAGVPEELRAPTSAPADGEGRLRIVQFRGPVKDEWLDQLRATGAFVVTYLPNDAYVVRTDPVADSAVLRLAAQPHVQLVLSYEPAFKLRPELRPPQIADSQFYDVIVQVIGDAEGERFAESLRERAVDVWMEPNRVLDYVDVGLVIDGANVLDLARDARVFAIEPKLEARLLDEAQGQIMAGNLNGTGSAPSGTGYLAWLQARGFPGTGANPFSFSVDVHDDGVDRGSTTDVNVEFKVDGLAAGASRVAYNHNYSGDSLADGRAGHGNINASIIGGYNNTAGTAYEDASGYQYGLGIAPWVRIGNSKVFNNAGSGVFNQPTLTRMANAYNAGARVSSNSWGYTSGTTYNADSQAHDTAVRDAVSGTAGNQELSIVFAAGNSGSASSTVHPPGTAKNIITVGASENYRQTGTDGCGIGNTGANDARDIISFSSRGPTSDSRKKPEIVAPGTHIEGAASRATGYDGSGVCNQYWPTGQTLYAWSSGTSHSTPAVAGFCALVRQWFANNSLGTPSPAMVKAYVIASATYMTGVGANDTLWSNSQGFGRTHLGRAFDSVARMRVDQTQVLGATGATYGVSGNIASSATPFRVVLAWTDAPGPTTGNAYVNNLDLEVTVNGTLYRGNVFTGASSVSGGAADPRNNTECVFLPAGSSGSFSIVVRATNIAGDGVPGNADTTDQDFALLVYNGTAGAPTPDFSLAATPSSSTVTAGSPASYSVTSTPLNGFAGNVTLSASPAITGVSYAFGTNPIGPSGSSVLTVATTTGAATGTHTISITGTSGSLVRTTSVSLTINAPGGGGNPVKKYTASPGLAIPDNNSTGVTSTINVPDGLTVSSISLSTTITHPYKGDLVVTLIGPDNTSAILHNRTGGSADNVNTTFSIVTAANQALSAFAGKNTAGAWKLKVQDLAAADIGTLDSWTIVFNGERGAAPNLAIPDNNSTGVTHTLAFTSTGTVASVRVRVNVTHTYKGDLEIALIAPDNTTVLLHNRSGGSTDNVNTEYPDLTAPAQSLSAFTGKAINGNWKLRVRDLAAVDTGTFVSWVVSFTPQ